ncbi:MAG: hypothetical protein NE327_04175 [Lentisphaeraceae bacterium]|nr:hypothetical protein [Lentisphaeraceae bacterium]
MTNSYVERLESKPALKGLDAFVNTLRGAIGNTIPKQWFYLKQAEKALQISESLSALSDGVLQSQLKDKVALAQRNKLTDRDLLEATALICEASLRTMKMKPYKVQVAAAIALQSGYIAEMATGEGKSLTAALAAVLLGWNGRGCHVMTSNHYLACRDAEEFTPLFEYCGLSVAAIDTEMQDDDRRTAYNKDITYCTNKDVAADFLRDQMSMGSKHTTGRLLLNKLCGEGNKFRAPILRGLEYAIVDEADSVMIDDGVTPLLISMENRNDHQVQIYLKSHRCAKAMTEEHYRIVEGSLIEITESGRKFLKKFEPDKNGPWSLKRRREELAVQALKAKLLFEKDKQYIVEEDKVIIVDQETGRTMPDRFWRNGMHQAVEAKEGLEISPSKDTCARISFQKFFRLYGFLCGMTGTASEASTEFYSLYNLPILKIPTHRKCLRKYLGHKVYSSKEAKWTAVSNEVEKWYKQGRPILIGTASIMDSEALSKLLTEKEIPHNVLNAKNHLKESEIVSKAGSQNSVTVATSMAGRGTDIKLDDTAKSLGGLLVIATELFPSGRVDRQLYGRCSRQGDPGSVICYHSLDDEIITNNIPILRLIFKPLVFLPNIFLLPFLKAAQKRMIGKTKKQRKAVMKGDDWLDEILGFTGESF